MTTREIIQKANRGNIANGDFDLNASLFGEIIPEFMDGLGHVAWSRKNGTITTVATVRDYDLPDDFWRMLLVVPEAAPNDELPYYGEDQKKVLVLESSTEQRKPSGYNFVGNVDSELKSLRFDYIPDAVYSFKFSYQWQLDEKNSSEDIDLNGYIPKRHQWALVTGLRREIMLDRFDQNDKRYIAEARKFDDAVKRASSLSNREQARRGSYGVFVG